MFEAYSALYLVTCHLLSIYCLLGLSLFPIHIGGCDLCDYQRPTRQAPGPKWARRRPTRYIDSVGGDRGFRRVYAPVLPNLIDLIN